MLSRFVAIIIAITAFAVGAKPCLAQKSVVVYQAEGETIDVSLPAWSNSHVTVYTPNSLANSPVHVELGLKTGYLKGGEDSTAVLMPNLGLTIRLSDNWFLRGTAAAGLADGGPVTEFGLGVGAWATDHLRFTASASQYVHRTMSWSWHQGSVVGKLATDYFLGTNAFVALEGFGGPSWDSKDQAGGCFGSTLGLGWRF